MKTAIPWRDEPKIDIVDLWKKYEDIAMHFNGLIMQCRVQALGAVALIATVSGVIANRKGDDIIRHRDMLFVCTLMLFAWLGIAAIDFLYYQKLLTGSVCAICQLENSSKTIRASLIIEEIAGGSAHKGAFYFYAGVTMALWSFVNYFGWRLTTNYARFQRRTAGPCM